MKPSLLLLGASAAPLAWLGQVMLGYGVSAFVCYPADHPRAIAAPGPLTAALIACDGIALAICAAGAFVSWSMWRKTRSHRQGYARFIALWGGLSSLWFFVAIVFNIIASVSVPPCLG